MRYAANTPPPIHKKPRPAEDLENKHGSNVKCGNNKKVAGRMNACVSHLRITNIARKQARGFAMFPSTTER